MTLKYFFRCFVILFLDSSFDQQRVQWLKWCHDNSGQTTAAEALGLGRQDTVRVDRLTRSPFTLFILPIFAPLSLYFLSILSCMLYFVTWIWWRLLHCFQNLGLGWEERITKHVASWSACLFPYPCGKRHSCFAAVASLSRAEQEDKLPGASSFSVTSARNRTGRLTDSSGLSSSRVLQGSCRKTLGHRRLPSITADSLRSRTPNVYSDEVLRGTKL